MPPVTNRLPLCRGFALEPRKQILRTYLSAERWQLRDRYLDDYKSCPIDLSSSSTQIVAVVSSSRGKMTGKEQYSISVVTTNGLWKFATVDISPIDRKPTDK